MLIFLIIDEYVFQNQCHSILGKQMCSELGTYCSHDELNVGKTYIVFTVCRFPRLMSNHHHVSVIKMWVGVLLLCVCVRESASV